MLPDAGLRVSFFERQEAQHLVILMRCVLQERRCPVLSCPEGEEIIMPLADLISSGGLLFAWTLATIILCLLGWLAFTLRQRQFRNDLDE